MHQVEDRIVVSHLEASSLQLRRSVRRIPSSKPAPGDTADASFELQRRPVLPRSNSSHLSQKLDLSQLRCVRCHDHEGSF